MLKRLFHERVETERLVLRKLNVVCGPPFLSGLSTKALQRWELEHTGIPPEVFDVTKSLHYGHAWMRMPVETYSIKWT